MANIIKKFKSNFEDITEYYNFLVSKTKKHEYVDITNEWLIDNYYLLVEHKNNIENNKKEIKKDIKEIEKNYFFIKNIVHKKNYNVSFKYLVDELKKQQKGECILRLHHPPGKFSLLANVSTFFGVLLCTTTFPNHLS